MTASAKISARILLAIQNGATIEQAMNEVLGAGSYEALVSDLYDALRDK
jgi:hypothetical protein